MLVLTGGDGKRPATGEGDGALGRSAAKRRLLGFDRGSGLGGERLHVSRGEADAELRLTVAVIADE